MRASLATDLMSDKQLWDRLSSELLAIQFHWTGGLVGSDIEKKALICRDCVYELKLRGTQGRLFG